MKGNKTKQKIQQKTTKSKKEKENKMNQKEVEKNLCI